MKITLRGVRGSIPTTGPDTNHYGGNTSCTELSEDGWTLILDGGSGIRLCNPQNEHKRVDILLTHLHIDHIQGLGFFRSLFDPEMEVHIWGPASSASTLHARLSRYLSPPLFPVRLKELPCKLEMHELENSTFDIGPFKIQASYVIHPGPTLGFRIQGKKSVFTYIPDHEPALGPGGILKDHRWISGFDLASESDMMLHDAQYNKREYEARVGWGHSSMDDAILFACRAETKHLLLSHHDPSHTDSKLDELFDVLRDKNHDEYKMELAAEGMEYELP